LKLTILRFLIVFFCTVSIGVTPIYSEAGKRPHKSFSVKKNKHHKVKQSIQKYQNGSINPRPKFWKSTVDTAITNAPKHEDGSLKCSTCGRKISKEKVNGRRDFDVDHSPTWESRKKKLDVPETTRRDVIEAYQEDIRIQCPSCNRSHKYEGGNSFLNSINNKQNLPE